jgi:hypothetical protein
MVRGSDVMVALPNTAAKSPRAPAWGEVPGTIRLTLQKLRANGRDYEDVGGMFSLERGALRLEGGHGRLPPYDTAKVEGSIHFEPAAALPYRLSGSAVLPDLSAGALLRPSNPAHLPVWEGSYTATIKSTGAAGDLTDLWRRRLDEFRLTSESGTLRLLGTQIADALPRTEPKTNETLARLGTALGEVFKTPREDEIEIIPSAITREAEDVLNLTYRLRAIPYSSLEVTAFLTADGTIHLNHIEIEAARERLTGTGRIAAAKSAGLTARPLRLDLKLAVRHEAVYALAESGLLTGEVDTKGYTRFAEPIRLEGTLDQIDDTQWREMLLRAALRARPAPLEQKPANR